ncbi:hypothetical protein C8R46DRAFT_1093209 [Mycena filopes]|nr:hypothetical protein C8R46DRAFT_1093209 [Mycena filopes]
MSAFPPSKPQLPRDLCKALKKNCVAAGSMIYTAFFSDVRHRLAMHADLPLAYEAVRLGTSIGRPAKAGITALYHGLLTLLDCLKAGPAEVVAAPLASTIHDLMTGTMRQVLLFLLSHHADPNESHNGVSVLHLACMGSFWDLVEALLLHGANPFYSVGAGSPAHVLKNNADKARFSSLASKYQGTTRPPRPPRICPCGSGSPLQDCHAVAGGKPYNPEYICCCGSRKIYSACCAKKAKIRYTEVWDEKAGRLVVDQFIPMPRNLTLRTRVGEDMSESERIQSQLQETEVGLATQMAASVLPTLQGDVLKRLLEAGRVDPAYAATALETKIHLALPNCVLTMSKVEWKTVMVKWNEAVDAYIASGGGPLHRRCEAPGCSKLEGRDSVHMLVCSGCHTSIVDESARGVLGLSTSCLAVVGKARLRCCPSQREHLAELSKIIGGLLGEAMPAFK